MVLAGVVGSAVLPAPLARRHGERTFLRVAAVVAAAGCGFLALAPGAAALAVIPLGFVLLGSLPVILELTERRAATSGAATALDLAGRQRGRHRRGRARAGQPQDRPGAGVLAAGGHRRARARGRREGSRPARREHRHMSETDNSTEPHARLRSGAASRTGPRAPRRAATRCS